MTQLPLCAVASRVYGIRRPLYCIWRCIGVCAALFDRCVQWQPVYMTYAGRCTVYGAVLVCAALFDRCVQWQPVCMAYAGRCTVYGAVLVCAALFDDLCTTMPL